MMETIDHLRGIFFLSAGFWIIVSFAMVLLVKSFIVDRYENQTNLLSTIYFKNHLNFVRAMPGFLSSALYSGHLIAIVWGWRFFGDKKIFSDINSPEDVLQYFSQSELRKVKATTLSGVVLLAHFVVMEIMF